MGDINTNIRIDELESQLNKKASADDFGMVKIGTGITVNNGVISVTGGGGGAGVTIDELWSGNPTTESTDISSGMAHPYSDYKILYFMQSTTNATAGTMIPVAGMVKGSTVENDIFVGPSTKIVVKLVDNEFRINGAVNVAGVKIYGIK